MGILPTINYKEFLKNPIVGILFISLISVGYLYVDNKSNYLKVISDQETRIDKLEHKVDDLTKKINERDSALMVISIQFSQLTKHDK